MTDYFGVNNFNSAYAQGAINKAKIDKIKSDTKVFEAESDTRIAQQKVEQLQRKINESNEFEYVAHTVIKELKEEKKELNKENIKLESEKEFYKNLLSKPMQEIASKNENFKETYEAQQFYLAEWIVSEMAFAETAYQIGIDVGKSKEEISEMYMENKVMVLHNQTNHGNNALSNKVIRENLDKLEDKILKKAQLNRIT